MVRAALRNWLVFVQFSLPAFCFSAAAFQLHLHFETDAQLITRLRRCEFQLEDSARSDVTVETTTAEIADLRIVKLACESAADGGFGACRYWEDQE